VPKPVEKRHFEYGGGGKVLLKWILGK